MTFAIPSGAKRIISVLTERGYDSYIVGGCVRDLLLGKEPNDWDICTSAKPDETIAALDGMHIVKTGLKHGTVTVILEDGPYEVTTFRVDGTYKDNRHPDSVRFVADIREDLARRDFTVNAMAYNETSGLIDPFGGREDLEKRVLRCVGEAAERFNEDALRIMRALRFSSVYGFFAEQRTRDAIHAQKDLLNNIAYERINVELCKTLCGKSVFGVLAEFSDVMRVVIPEFAPCVGFAQRNKYHQYDVYEHIARSVASYGGNDVRISLALLLHDIGKPECFTLGRDGVGHFYGHAGKSVEIASRVMSRLRFDNETQRVVTELIEYHDVPVNDTEKSVRRLVRKLGYDQFARLMELKRADILAQADIDREKRIGVCRSAADIAQKLKDSGACMSRKDLAVNGGDLIKAGVPEGVRIGMILERVLALVTEGELENDRDAILEYVKRIKR